MIIIFNGKYGDSHPRNNLINNIRIREKVGSSFPYNEVMIVYKPKTFKESGSMIFFIGESNEMIFLPKIHNVQNSSLRLNLIQKIFQSLETDSLT